MPVLVECGLELGIVLGGNKQRDLGLPAGCVVSSDATGFESDFQAERLGAFDEALHLRIEFAQPAPVGKRTVQHGAWKIIESLRIMANHIKFGRKIVETALDEMPKEQSGQAFKVALFVFQNEFSTLHVTRSSVADRGAHDKVFSVIRRKRLTVSARMIKTLAVTSPTKGMSHDRA
jgi:hypothetical protein